MITNICFSVSGASCNENLISILTVEKSSKSPHVFSNIPSHRVREKTEQMLSCKGQDTTRCCFISSVPTQI